MRASTIMTMQQDEIWSASSPQPATVTTPAIARSFNDTEAMLAQELNKLSVKERTQALEDMHGVSTVLDEEPELITRKLLELHMEITKQRHKTYLLAERLSNSYVQNSDFRLMFLRADSLDVKAAAQRLFSFLEFKLQLFGEGKLVKDLKLADLNEDDMESLRSGQFQEMSETDRAGRVIVLGFHQLRTYKANENILRAYFYFMMTVVTRRPDVQIKGFVFAFYNTSSKAIRPNPQVTWRLLKLRHAMPLRSVTHHLCIGKESNKLVYNVCVSMWYHANRSYGRVRSRRHIGTDKEVKYKLQGFGFPMKDFPVGDDGEEVNLTFHRQWLQRRRELEQVTSAPVITPSLPLEEAEVYLQKGAGAASPSVVSEEPFMQSNTSNDMQNTVSLDTSPHSNCSAPCIQTMPQSIELPIPNEVLQKPHESGFSVAGTTASFNRIDLAAMSNNHQSITPAIQLSSPVPAPAPVLAHGSFFSHPGMSFQQQPPQLPPEVQTKAAAAAFSGGYVIPKPEDVLFGRGKPTRNHPGNIRFRNLMENHAEEYNKAPKFVKSLIAKKLVQIVTSSGSRFMKPMERTNNHWVMVDEKTAQDKVSQYFRSRRGSR